MTSQRHATHLRTDPDERDGQGTETETTTGTASSLDPVTIDRLPKPPRRPDRSQLSWPEDVDTDSYCPKHHRYTYGDTARSHQKAHDDACPLHGNPHFDTSKSHRNTYSNTSPPPRTTAPMLPSPAWINQTMFRKYVSPTPPASPDINGSGAKRSRFSILSFGHWPRANLNLNFPPFGGDGLSSASTTQSSTDGDRHEKDTTNFGDLFFDLLFAANLDVYTEAVSLDNVVQVGGFLGWFVVLWW